MAVTGIVLILLGMFVGISQAGMARYMRDHEYVQRTHHENPEYATLLDKYEMVGGVIGARPGTMLLMFDRRRKSSQGRIHS